MLSFKLRTWHSDVLAVCILYRYIRRYSPYLYLNFIRCVYYVKFGNTHVWMAFDLLQPIKISDARFAAEFAVKNGIFALDSDVFNVLYMQSPMLFYPFDVARSSSRQCIVKLYHLMHIAPAHHQFIVHNDVIHQKTKNTILNQHYTLLKLIYYS